MVEASLFEELEMRRQGTVLLMGMAGENTQARAFAREISVNGLALQTVEVISLTKLNLGPSDHHVRGVLGENFLDHFDLLIDNQHQKITLDARGRMADSFAGEQLPMSSSNLFEGSELKHRPTVSITVPSFASRPLRLLVDSGINELAIFPPKGMEREVSEKGFAQAAQMMTAYGLLPCMQWKDKLRWAKFSVSNVDVISCESATADKTDIEGTLPTSIFKQILISHANSYVIVNPVKRSHTLREIDVIASSVR